MLRVGKSLVSRCPKFERFHISRPPRGSENNGNAFEDHSASVGHPSFASHPGDYPTNGHVKS